MEAKYVAFCEADKEVVCLHKFLANLEVVPDLDKPITLYYNNTGDMANSKKSRSHKRGKYMKRKLSH